MSTKYNILSRPERVGVTGDDEEKLFSFIYKCLRRVRNKTCFSQTGNLANPLPKWDTIVFKISKRRKHFLVIFVFYNTGNVSTYDISFREY